MQPPESEMGRARACIAKAGETLGDHQPDRRTEGGDANRMLPNDAQAFDEVTGDADGNKRTENIPVCSPMTDAGRAAGPTPKKKNAPGDKEQPEDINGELVNDV